MVGDIGRLAHLWYITDHFSLSCLSNWPNLLQATQMHFFALFPVQEEHCNQSLSLKLSTTDCTKQMLTESMIEHKVSEAMFCTIMLCINMVDHT